MPTYDYRCGACGHTFEHFQAISDPLLKKCPECRKPKLERLIGAGAGFLFKGAGFYITDYRSSSYQEGAKKESGAGKPEKTAGASGEKGASKSSDGAATTSGDKSPAPAKNASASTSTPPAPAPSAGGKGSSASKKK